MAISKPGIMMAVGAIHAFVASDLFSLLRKRAKVLPILLILEAPLHGQQQTMQQNPDLGSVLMNSGQSNQSSPMVDCVDPAEATSPECLITPMGGVQSSTGGQRGANQFPQQQGNSSATGNYTDLEQLTRPNQTGLRQQPRPLPPERLTEFQKFIASSTGEVLPIYGANLFRRVPSTFAPLDAAPAPPNYVIGPGDELRIRVWGQISFQANLRVDRSGDIYIPQVGPVHVANLAFSDLNDQLRSALDRVYHNVDLTVSLGQIRSIQVYLAGAALRPGVYTVSSLSTLVDALFVSGGPSTAGSLRSIELRRDGATVTRFDLYSLLVRGDKSKDMNLLSGDVIFIPPVGLQVAVTGSVKAPAIYEVLPGESIGDVLADAGNLSAMASGAHISIERTEDRRTRHAMEVNYDESGLKTQLADGDLVRVFSIVPRFSDTVTLRGNIATPGRFAWHPGMRITDLIPDKESLITRDYWWRRSQLGLPSLEFEPVAGLQSMRQPAENGAITLKRPVENDSDSSDSAQNPNASEATDQEGAAAGTDALHSQSNKRRVLTAQQRASASTVGGQQEMASRFQGTYQPTSVRQLSPDIDWDYATIERIDPGTLKTLLLPFDLGKLVLEHDESQNLELRSGDIVSIFSEADIRVPLAKQTKLVTLEGEFVHSGVYTVRPGETLRELVSRAGGITPKAYLYGSEFTRESTRASQQARIDEYVQNLQMSINRSTVAIAAQDVAAATVGQSAEKDLLTALKQIRASGRIVLQFKPQSNALGVVPDIALENGDRFVIPPTPATINVVGAVYNQNSFLYVEGRTLGNYLLDAGGANRDADRKHEFVIRANGDVVSRDRQSGWDNRFSSLRMNPGDSIVVPSKTIKPSALKGAIEWTQLFSQLALGAASINVIK